MFLNHKLYFTFKQFCQIMSDIWRKKVYKMVLTKEMKTIFRVFKYV